MCLEAVVCKHFQTGYCKFREHCRKHHVSELCDKANCNSKACKKRHPTICKYFTAHNVCRYQDKCAYLHTITEEKSDTAKLLSKVDHLEDTLKVMSKKVLALEEKLEIMNIESNPSLIQTFKCDQCDYKASKNSVLKRHKTFKHNTVISALEQERSTTHDDSLQLVLPLQEREDETCLDSTPSIEANHLTPTLTHLKFECDLCQHESKSTAALHGHISVEHNPNIPHTSKWEKNKCHICSKIDHPPFNTTEHFKSHMLEQHGFVQDSTVCLQCESPGPLGYYTPVPDQLIYMICKECELWDESNP